MGRLREQHRFNVYFPIVCGPVLPRRGLASEVGGSPIDPSFRPWEPDASSQVFLLYFSASLAVSNGCYRASRSTSPLGQVTFNDTSGSGDASAVQLDQHSSYKAEGTAFMGFDGEVCARRKAKLLHTFGRRESTARDLLDKVIDLMDKFLRWYSLEHGIDQRLPSSHIRGFRMKGLHLR